MADKVRWGVLGTSKIGRTKVLPGDAERRVVANSRYRFARTRQS